MSIGESLPFRSPISKLLRFFYRSRDKWKTKCKAAITKTGVPRAIISDHGGDLHAGIERFRKAHPTTAWLYDIKHKTACLLKHALEHDASWQVFVEKVHRFKQQVPKVQHLDQRD